MLVLAMGSEGGVRQDLIQTGAADRNVQDLGG
jgi:hypothetical protein